MEYYPAIKMNEVMSEEWTKKMWYTYAMEYYPATKMNEIMSFAATCIDLAIVILSEVSQTEGEMLYDIPYMQNLKRNDTNKLTYKT